MKRTKSDYAFYAVVVSFSAIIVGALLIMIFGRDPCTKASFVDVEGKTHEFRICSNAVRPVSK